MASPFPAASALAVGPAGNTAKTCHHCNPPQTFDKVGQKKAHYRVTHQVQTTITSPDNLGSSFPFCLSMTIALSLANRLAGIALQSKSNAPGTRTASSTALEASARLQRRIRHRSAATRPRIVLSPGRRSRRLPKSTRTRRRPTFR